MCKGDYSSSHQSCRHIPPPPTSYIPIMPLLSSRHRKERMDFAIAHKDWTVENWKMVVYSDETKINRLGSDGKKWVWKKKGEHRVGDRMMEGAMKFGGGSVMVWGCMMWEGVGYACKIDGKMDKHLYIFILEDVLQASLQYHDKTPQDIIFQHDGDPKHQSHQAKYWLKDMDSRSSHGLLNLQILILLSICGIISKGGLVGMKGHKEGYWSCGRGESGVDKITASVCQDLIESMPRRVEAVLRAK